MITITISDLVIHSSALVVGRWVKWHFGDFGISQLASDLDLDLGSGLVVWLVEENLGNVAAAAWGRRARANGTDLLGRLIGGEDLVAVSWGRPLGNQADSFEGDGLGVVDLADDSVCAVEGGALGRSSGLGDEPVEGGLDRGDVVVQLVAVETHAGLQSEGVSGGQADRLDDFVVLEKRVEEVDADLAVRDGDLEAVLARVAAPGDVELGVGAEALEVDEPRVAEVQVVERGVGELGDNLLRLRALDGEKRALEVLVLDLLSLVELGELLLEEGRVLVSAAGVRDHVVRVVAVLRDDRVVHHAARLVEQHAQVALERLQHAEVRGTNLLQEAGCVGPGDAVLQHVRHVEHPAVRSRPVVRLDVCLALVQHGHRVPGERNHCGAELHVGVVQRRLEQLLGGLGGVRSRGGSAGGSAGGSEHSVHAGVSRSCWLFSLLIADPPSPCPLSGLPRKEDFSWFIYPPGRAVAETCSLAGVTCPPGPKSLLLTPSPAHGPSHSRRSSPFSRKNLPTAARIRRGEKHLLFRPQKPLL